VDVRTAFSGQPSLQAHVAQTSTAVRYRRLSFDHNWERQTIVWAGRRGRQKFGGGWMQVQLLVRDVKNRIRKPKSELWKLRNPIFQLVALRFDLRVFIM
jgi:hypothetical protein